MKEEGVASVAYKIDAGLEVIGFIKMKNGCCPDKPVLVTKVKGADPPLYGCECACGMWCTTALRHVDHAINHYRRMGRGEDLYSEGQWMSERKKWPWRDND